MSTVLIQLDGETDPRALSDLAWETVAPCGCTYGIALAEYIGHDQAAAVKHLEPSAEQRRRDQAAGFVVRLVAHADSFERFKGQCEHDPKWGVPSPLVPDGYRWAEATRDARRQHLVRVPADADERWSEWTKPLCGGKTSLFVQAWRLPTCRTCERRARDLPAAVSS